MFQSIFSIEFVVFIGISRTEVLVIESVGIVSALASAMILVHHPSISFTQLATHHTIHHITAYHAPCFKPYVFIAFFSSSNIFSCFSLRIFFLSSISF
jgi:hypothetical protein